MDRSSPSCRIGPNSHPFTLLQTLPGSQKTQPVCNQSNPNSLCKTPRVGRTASICALRSTSAPRVTLSPLSTAFTPNPPLTPLSTAFTHSHPGCVCPSYRIPSLSASVSLRLCGKSRLPSCLNSTESCLIVVPKPPLLAAEESAFHFGSPETR
jgi:hypothetical protein